MADAMRTTTAAAAYFLAVFAVGAVLGTVRELWLLPRLGPLGAVLVEAPAMLAASVFAARWAVRRFAIAPHRGTRLRMGAAALSLLAMAEAAGSLGLRGLALRDWLAGFGEPQGLVALALFLAFAAMPALVARRGG